MKRPDDSIPDVLFCVKRQGRNEESRMCVWLRRPLTGVTEQNSSRTGWATRHPTCCHVPGQVPDEVVRSKVITWVILFTVQLFLLLLQLGGTSESRQYWSLLLLLHYDANVKCYSLYWGGGRGSLQQDCLTAPCHILSSEVPPLTRWNYAHERAHLEVRCSLSALSPRVWLLICRVNHRCGVSSGKKRMNVTSLGENKNTSRSIAGLFCRQPAGLTRVQGRLRWRLKQCLAALWHFLMGEARQTSCLIAHWSWMNTPASGDPHTVTKGRSACEACRCLFINTLLGCVKALFCQFSVMIIIIILAVPARRVLNSNEIKAVPHHETHWEFSHSSSLPPLNSAVLLPQLFTISVSMLTVIGVLLTWQQAVS